MTYEFKPGDRVRLTPAAVAFYGGVWPHFVPQGQGGGTPGTIILAEDRPFRPGAAPRPYYVKWDNGIENSYRIEDLEGLEEREEASAQDAKIIPFRRGV